jgi:UDPglucose--hexose-1-phosphate uridylyltransferase
MTKCAGPNAFSPSNCLAISLTRNPFKTAASNPPASTYQIPLPNSRISFLCLSIPPFFPCPPSIASENPERLIDLADRILTAWRGYTDKDAFIFAETDGEPHNTITPIARRRGEKFELDLVLRNNITTKEHPLGVYHPHAELHHIKKENIGLIEVMGLAVLPARLKEELAAVAKCLATGSGLRVNELTAKHADWAEGFVRKYTITKENALDIVQKETGLVFAQVLEHAGVYKRSNAGKQAFVKFLEEVK